MPRCTAHQRNGLPCRRRAVAGKEVCARHGGGPRAGAPRGNQNALKHGLYSKAIPDGYEGAHEEALALESLEKELALLRVRIAHALRPDNPNPPDLDQLSRAFHEVGNLVKIQFGLTGGRADQLDDALDQALVKIGQSLGIQL